MVAQSNDPDLGARVDRGWFQGRLADKRISQRELARLMGVDPSAVTLMFRGRRQISAGEAATIARVIDAPVAEVLSRAGIEGLRGYSGSVAGNDGAIGEVKIKSASESGESMASAKRGGDGPAQPKDQTTHPHAPLNIPIPLADGSVCHVLLAGRLTREDSDRIAAIVAAMVVAT